jgi:hypothetical protein
MTTTHDTTQLYLRFYRLAGLTYIAVDDAVATLRAVLPDGAAFVEFVEGVELDWRRAAERAFSR